MDVGMVIIVSLIGFVMGLGTAAYLADDIKESNENLLDAYKDYIAALERRHDTEEKLRKAMTEKAKTQAELIANQDNYIAFLKGELEKVQRDNREMTERLRFEEIFRLKEWLEEREIPFTFEHHQELGGYQIQYPNAENRVCSVILNRYSYGSEMGLLELMGLRLNGEADAGCIAGSLTAKETLRVIVSHWQSNQAIIFPNQSK